MNKDKKGLALLILGKMAKKNKKPESDESDESDDMSAAEEAMNDFINAVHDKDPKAALDAWKMVCEFSKDDEEEKDESEEDDDDDY